MTLRTQPAPIRRSISRPAVAAPITVKFLALRRTSARMIGIGWFTVPNPPTMTTSPSLMSAAASSSGMSTCLRSGRLARVIGSNFITSPRRHTEQRCLVLSYASHHAGADRRRLRAVEPAEHTPAVIELDEQQHEWSRACMLFSRYTDDSITLDRPRERFARHRVASRI